MLKKGAGHVTLSAAERFDSMDNITIILNDPPYGVEMGRMLDLARWTKESDSVVLF